MSDPHESTTVHVLLNCRHRVKYRKPVPEIGDTVWCVRCNSEALVHSAPDEWRWRCRSCHTSRPYGVERIACELGATRHMQKFPSHVVLIINGKQPVVTLGDEDAHTERVGQTTRELLARRFDAARQGTLFDMTEGTRQDTSQDAPF